MAKTRRMQRAEMMYVSASAAEVDEAADMPFCRATGDDGVMLDFEDAEVWDTPIPTWLQAIMATCTEVGVTVVFLYP